MAGNKNSGRPAKPTATLKLHGTYREDRHAERFDDSALSSEIATPAQLSEMEAKCWDEIVPDLQAAGYVKRLDSAELRGLIEWLARYRMAMLWLKVRQTSESYRGADSEEIDQIAKIQGMAQKAWSTFFIIAGRFGMSPADRAKLATEQKPKQNEFDKDLAKHA